MILYSGLAAGAIALSGGGTGLLSVPDAGVLPRHTLMIQHTNGIIPLDEAAEVLGGQLGLVDSAAASHLQLSVIPRIEIGTSLTTWYADDDRRLVNEFSSHAKWQLLDKSGFRLALGGRGFGGAESRLLRPTSFAVADWQGKRWQLSLGYGHSETEGVALDGAFGGVRFQATDAISLIVDYDGIALNAGARVSGHWRRLGVFAQAHYTDLEQQDVVLTAGLQMPLGRSNKVVPKTLPKAKPFAQPLQAPDLKQRREFLHYREGAELLANEYAVNGLQQPNGLCGPFTEARAQNIPLLATVCDEGGARARWRTTWASTASSRSVWAQPISIRLEPAVRYALGSEYSRADWAVAARGSAEWHSPLGLGGYGVWDLPLQQSENYEPGEAFGRQTFASGLYEYAGQFQMHLLPGVFVQAMGGQTHVDNRPVDFTRYEIALHLFGGRLGLNYHQTEFDDALERVADTQSIGKVFAWLWRSRLAIEFSSGEYLYGDKGQRWDVYQYAGRFRFGAYYKDGDEYQAVGVTASIPLTPRIAYQRSILRFAGTEHFTPNLESSFDDEDDHNHYRPQFMQEFTPQRNLIEDVLDQWRYSPYYLRNR